VSRRLPPLRRWYAGVNRPGHLPEQFPVQFETWQQAFEHIRGEVHGVFLASADRETLAVSDEALLDVAPAAQVLATTPVEQPFMLLYHGYHWWVADLPEPVERQS
jgi:hypothetical protein